VKNRSTNEQEKPLTSKAKQPEPIRILGEPGSAFWKSVDKKHLNRQQLEELQVLCEQIDERIALRLQVLRTGQVADRNALRALDAQIVQAIEKYRLTNNQPEKITNRQALEQTIQILQTLGRLENIDVALVNLTRSAAQIVDEHPTPSAVKEYAQLLDRLKELGKDDDGLAHLIDELRAESLDKPDT
jgi:hypothetical protein